MQMLAGLSLSLTQFLLTFLEGDLPSESPLGVLPLKYTGRERRTWLFEKGRFPFRFFWEAGHGHGICALMQTVSRKKDLSLCRGHSHSNRFAHYGSTEPTSTGSYLSQPQVWYSPISSFLFARSSPGLSTGAKHNWASLFAKYLAPQCYPNYIINIPCASTEKSILKEKKIWRYWMGKQTGTAQKLAGFQEPNTWISLLSSVLFSVLTLLFKYYWTMFVCFL